MQRIGSDRPPVPIWQRALAELGNLSAGWPWLMAAAALLIALSLLARPGTALPLRASGLTLVALAFALLASIGLARLRQARRIAALADLFGRAPEPVWLTTSEGRLLWSNAAADPPGALLAALCEGSAREPGPLAGQMLRQTLEAGLAQDVINSRFGRTEVQVRPVTAGLLWRVQGIEDNAAEPEALARVTLSPEGRVVHVSPALRGQLARRPETAEELFTALPVRSGEVQNLLTASGPRPVLALILPDTPGRTEVLVLPQSCAAAPSSDPGSFEGLPVALLKLDGRGQITATNRASRALLGPLERGTRLSDVFEGLGRPLSDWIADAFQGRTERKPEVLRRKGQDGDSYVQITLVRIVEGGLPGLVAILVDATQMKSLEGQMLQSQKMHAIGQLAGGIAHDFNNLLTAISGHCDLLMLRHDFGDPDYGDLDQIRQNSNRAAALVSQLLAFSRKQTSLPSRIDLRDVMSDLGHLLGRLVGEKVTLRITPSESLPQIRADRRQVEQVIVNLVVNARDALQGNGLIRVEMDCLSLAEPMARGRATVPEGDWAVLRVIDHGMGMTEDVRDRIFEPFFTTKKSGEGTGLGLSTVYGIMKQSGGFIFCDSALGMGAVFTLYFPAARKDAPEAESDETVSNAEPARGGRILLVEDESSVRAFSARALRLHGFDVVEAESGEAALALLEVEDKRVDLFLSDVIMPGLDGPGWISRVGPRWRAVPTLFVSGYAEESFRDDHASIPGAQFLAKPFALTELVSRVQAMLSSKEQETDHNNPR